MPSSPGPAAGATLTLFELTMGATMTQAIAVACRLEIPDRLDGRPRSAEDLATVTGCSPQMVGRLLHLLDSLGIVSRHKELYSLTDFGSPLRRSASPSLRGWALMAGAPWFWAPLGRLEECLTDDRSGSTWSTGARSSTCLPGTPSREHARSTTRPWEEQ